MRTIVFALILALACGKPKIDNAGKPPSVPGEKVYALQGKSSAAMPPRTR